MIYSSPSSVAVGFKDRPDSQAQSILSFFLFERSLLPADKIELVKSSQHSDVSRRLEQILTSVSSHVAYIHSGHMGEDHALDFYRSTVASFRAQKNDQSDGNVGEEEFERLRQLPSGKHSVLALGPFNKEDENNAYLLYIQVCDHPSLALIIVITSLLTSDGSSHGKNAGEVAVAAEDVVGAGFQHPPHSEAARLHRFALLGGLWPRTQCNRRHRAKGSLEAILSVADGERSGGVLPIAIPVLLPPR